MPNLRTSPNVAYTRPEYTSLSPRWDLIRDCVAGGDQVKSKGDKYLPRPNPSDLSTENQLRYAQYKDRAVFYGVSGRTLNGLVGQVMRKSPLTELPPLLRLLIDDVDGGGVALDQQAQKALSYVLAYGRCGLLVDHPPTEPTQGVKLRDLQQGNIRPTINFYDPWDIINWRTKTIGGKVVLEKVVLSEVYVTDDDGFEQEWDPQWRVLKLTPDNVYVIEEWIKDPNNDEEFIMKSSHVPTDSRGKPFNEIPFFFIGSQNNDPHPDLPPLYDLAALNIAHYRNSADYEESCYICGQPTPWVSGLTEDWVESVWKDQPVTLGSRAAISLPEGGQAGLLQAAPNSMPQEAMEHKERQMVALGAKLVEQKQVQRTATEASMDEASESSVLATASRNVSTAYTHALEVARKFVDSADGSTITYALNLDFEIHTLSPQDRQQLIAEWQSGAILEEEMRDVLMEGGIATVDYEEYKTRAEAEELTRPLMPTASGAGQPQQPGGQTSNE